MLSGDHCDSVMTVMVAKEKLYKAQVTSLGVMIDFKDAQNVAKSNIINLQDSQLRELRGTVKRAKAKTVGVSILCAVIVGTVVFLSVP